METRFKLDILSVIIHGSLGLVLMGLVLIGLSIHCEFRRSAQAIPKDAKQLILEEMLKDCKEPDECQAIERVLKRKLNEYSIN